MDPNTHAEEIQMLDKDVLHATRGLASNRKASKWPGPGYPPNGDAGAWTAKSNAVLIPATLDGNQVIAHGNVGVLDADIAA
jgi:hypothetical protein